MKGGNYYITQEIIDNYCNDKLIRKVIQYFR